MSIVSNGALAAHGSIAPLTRFVGSYLEKARQGADFTFGNPHEMPLPGLSQAIQKAAEPQSSDWFAYKMSVRNAQETVASALSEELSLTFDADDITMTNGAYGAIALAFDLLLDPGDEVIHPCPGWFLYTPVLAKRGYVSVPVLVDPDTHDLDLDAIEKAITPKTRIVVVNTPHNPTGQIYSRERLAELGDLLSRYSALHNQRIFILSDEPYRRIRFDGAEFTSPAEVYPWTLIDYSYGKVLLAPGQRIGYLALGPHMPEADRAALRNAIFPVQMGLGWGYPDATMQHAIPDLEKLTLDMDVLTSKRDRMLNALSAWGYQMARPAGTFYLWGRAPGGDSLRFFKDLAERNVYVLPGALFDCPGDFRICLTATSDMVETALPVFEELARNMETTS